MVPTKTEWAGVAAPDPWSYERTMCNEKPNGKKADARQQCAHGTAHLPGEFVGLRLYDDTGPAQMQLDDLIADDSCTNNDHEPNLADAEVRDGTVVTWCTDCGHRIKRHLEAVLVWRDVGGVDDE
jgi:hypothetical protein